MALISTQNQSIDRTVKIFDNFYNKSITIPSNQYDVVLSYFKGVCETETIAKNFTAFLFKIAQESGVDAMTLLENIKGSTKNKLELNQVLAYYLNSFKSKTSLYGVAVIPRPVQPVARNVVL
jgi:hypothetical protein